MTSIARSASDATSSVFNTVATTAQTLTRTVDTAGAGLDMLNSFVLTARKKQIARTAIDMETFYEELHEESAMDMARRQRALTNELNQDEDLKIIFKENYNKLNEIILKLKTPVSED